MGGLSAAIHARLKGYEVTVIEKAPGAGGKARPSWESGYRFDLGPSIIILTDIYRAVFELAGRRMEDYLEFVRLDPITRVYFEGTDPFDIPADRQSCLQVLGSRFPEDRGAVEQLLNQLDGVMPRVRASVFAHPYDRPWKLLDLNLLRIGSSLGARTPYKKFIDDLFKSQELRAFFYGFPSYGGQTYDVPSPGSLLIPYLMIQEGVFYPVGGVGSIVDAFFRLASDLEVEFRFDEEVTDLVRHNREVSKVVTTKGEYACASVISNIDRSTLGSMLGRKESRAPSLSYLTMSLALSKPADGFSHHNLFLPSDYEPVYESIYLKREFPENPIVYANSVTEMDPTAAPSDTGNLFLVATSPAEEPGMDWKTFKTEAEARVLATLRRCGIELTPQSICSQVTQTPSTFRVRDGNYRGSLYGLDQRHRLFGMMPAPNWDQEYRNLIYCGGTVQPGAGLPMVTLSGKFAADLL